MKIIYLTTAQKTSDYVDYLSKCGKAPNMSNQNFHNKLIRALSLKHKVFVVSQRSINRHFASNTLHSAASLEKNIVWNYVKVKSSKIDKMFHSYSRIKETVAKIITKDDIIFVDTMSISLMYAAKKLSKKYGCKTVGICTDNPYNISLTNDVVKYKLLSLGQSLDKFIALTPKIEEIYNINEDKPNVIIDGITEENNFKTSYKLKRPYIFFGGSLMRKYGIYNLIDAFDALHRNDIDLVICGHHEEGAFKSIISSYKHIIYLGAIPYEDICALEKEAICAVNPRPIDPQIDDYSIPSKTLEYLSNGAITITVKNEILLKRYKDGIIWSETGDVKDLRDCLKLAIKMKDEERKKMSRIAKKLAKTYTSFEYVNKIIDTLL